MLSQKRHNLSHQVAKAPNTTMLPSLGNRRARMNMYGKNDLALHLFFTPLRQLLRFDFNAFCVVLYFHAKILLYLNVFILLNVFNFFWLLYPRIAVIILMSQYLTSFCERDQRKERKTLNIFSSNVDSFTFAILKRKMLKCAFTILVQHPKCLSV